MARKPKPGEPVMLCTVHDDLTANRIEALLLENDIPMLKKQLGNGGITQLYMSIPSAQGMELQVMPENLDKANSLLQDAGFFDGAYDFGEEGKEMDAELAAEKEILAKQRRTAASVLIAAVLIVLAVVAAASGLFVR